MYSENILRESCMFDFIFIVNDVDIALLNKSILSLQDCTNKEFIGKIIVLTKLDLDLHGVTVIKYSTVQDINEIISRSDAKNICLFNNIVKFSPGWCMNVRSILNENPTTLCGVKVFDLDLDSWASKPEYIGINTFDNRLSLYNKDSIYEPKETAIITSYNICINKDRFIEIGMFDEGMNHYDSTDVEISIRNFVLNGENLIDNTSFISMPLHRINDNGDRSRTIGITFDKISYIFNHQLQAGRTNNVNPYYDKGIRTIKQYLQEKTPSLYCLPSYHKRYAGTEISILSTGPTIDMIKDSYIERSELLIGVDYLGLLFQCDYVITDNYNIINVLNDYYDEENFLIPDIIYDNKLKIKSKDKYNKSNIFSLLSPGQDINNGNMIINYDSVTLMAVHLAILMKPKSIYLYAFDNRIIDGKSHTSKIEYYNNGRLFPYSNATQALFSYYEQGLNKLTTVAKEQGTNIIRISCA